MNSNRVLVVDDEPFILRSLTFVLRKEGFEVSEARNGETVVALVDGSEATLKRFRRKGASVALEAANPAYETRVYAADQVRVQGRLVGLIRSY